jgi:cytoskeletal protein CcmA (bactofilin family)
MEDNPLNQNQDNSLETESLDSSLQNDTPEVTPGQVVSEGGEGSAPAGNGVVTEQPAGGGPSGPKKSGPWRRLFDRFNIYLLLFVAVLLIAGAVFVAAWVANRGSDKPTVQTQSLTEDALKQLANNDVTVGQPKQILNVQSNAVFAGKVLIQDSLEVAGPIQVGGSLSIPGITVSGSSIFDEVQINKTLSVAGDSAFQGQLSVQKSLSVAGGGTFGGAISAPQITANTLQLNGNLNLTHHIAAGGATPGRSNGGNLGSGGTTNVGGSDSAGSVNINTGVGASAGCFVTVNFTQRYNETPHVLLTPVGSAAASLDYYVNRNTSSFSICTASTPPSSSNFGFDYFVVE